MLFRYYEKAMDINLSKISITDILIWVFIASHFLGYDVASITQREVGEVKAAYEETVEQTRPQIVNSGVKRPNGGLVTSSGVVADIAPTPVPLTADPEQGGYAPPEAPEPIPHIGQPPATPVVVNAELAGSVNNTDDCDHPDAVFCYEGQDWIVITRTPTP